MPLPSKRRIRRTVPFLLITLIAAIPLLFSCQARLDPVYDRTGTATEFESVWQYLKAYSIYQDSVIYQGRIPSNPFAFSSPAAVLAAVHDTLKGYQYTDYVDESGTPDTVYDTAHAWISPVASAIGGVSSADGIVSVDTLTDSTAILTIATFEAPTDGQIYNDFLALSPILAHFKNIIVDLDSNSGGYIDEAQNIISAMVPLGTNYVLARERDYDTVQNQFVTRDWHYWTTTNAPLFTGKHYAIISNDRTASAAELCLDGLYEGQKKEWGTPPPLLGSRSYGKGIGQVLIQRRNAYSSTYPSLDTFYNQAGDSMQIVPVTVTDYLMLRITFLQLQGVSPRIGLYHDVGIPADTVPFIISNQVANALKKYPVYGYSKKNDNSPYDSLIWTATLCAEKILEPSVNLDSLVNPAVTGILAKALPRSLTKPAVRKNVRAVAEKVIKTDKLFPLK